MENIQDREKKLLPCPIGLKGFCCDNCLMGPCRVMNEKMRGVCGAKREVIVARNILRFVAGGTAAHAGHAHHFLSYLNESYPKNYIKNKAPNYLYKLWKKLNIIPEAEMEHFKDISEALHTSTMGVNADYKDLLVWSMKLGVLDGYYGLYLATELENKIYGKPKPKTAELNLGVIKKDKVNIAIHGHEPMLAEILVKEVKKKENIDINLIGVCCTGASVLQRHGIPLAANFVLQEDVISTGAIEVMVVDVQCIMPSVGDLCECYHTKLITTNDLCKIPNAMHLPVNDKRAAEKVAKQIIKLARENRKKRREISLSKEKKKVVVGFSPETIPMKKIIQGIKNKKIKGIIGVVGCDNPRVKEDWSALFKKLSKDHIILATGCIAFKLGQAGLLDGKRVFHMGSCVNNARIAETFKQIADRMKKEITDLPFLVSCPMPTSEKSVAIGFFFASIGVDVHFGYPFMFKGDKKVEDFLGNVLKKEFKSKIFLEEKIEDFENRLKNEGLSISKK